MNLDCLITLIDNTDQFEATSQTPTAVQPLPGQDLCNSLGVLG